MNSVQIKKTVEEYLKLKGLPQAPALTFEDVTIIDLYSEIPSRSSIKDTKAFLTPDFHIEAPICSSNMDTVTEHQMAIAMARLGGIGFIHQFLPIEKRKKEIELVKRADSGIIEKPLTATPDMTLKQAKEIMASYKISSLLVVDENRKLAGILANRDYNFENDDSKRVGQLMKKNNLITAPPRTNPEKAKQILFKHKIEKLPLVDKKGFIKGLITTKDLEKVTKFPKASRDKKGHLLVGATVGIANDILGEIEELLRAGADIILIDTARGNSSRLVEILKRVRRRFGKKLPLVAGNVDTPEGVITLIKAGAGGIKAGIGGGSACKTRMGPGVGIPYITAIAECYAISSGFGIPIMSDGGIKNSSDLAKILVAGADTAMMGGLLAGTEETPGKPFYEDGEKWKIYRGSASIEFQMSRIDRDERENYIRTPEGVPKRVKYKGEVANVIEELIGHLNSAMSYVGAWTLKEFRQKGRFRWQTLAGYEEGKPHDVL